MSAFVHKGFWRRALDGCRKWHFALISPVRLLNCRTDRLLVKFLPNNLESGSNAHKAIAFMMPSLVYPLTPLHENRNVEEKLASFITAAFSSHTELTIIRFNFFPSPLVISLFNATGFSRTLSTGFCGFQIAQTVVSVLPIIIIANIGILKAFLEFGIHQIQFIEREIKNVNCF